MEKETLGFYVSGHPFDVYEPYVNRKISCPVEQLFETSNNTEVISAGLISSVVNRYTKKGDQMANFHLEKQQGFYSLYCFS